MLQVAGNGLAKRSREDLVAKSNNAFQQPKCAWSNIYEKIEINSESFKNNSNMDEQ